jgi:hypothetical protein
MTLNSSSINPTAQKPTAVKPANSGQTQSTPASTSGPAATDGYSRNTEVLTPAVDGFDRPVNSAQSVFVADNIATEASGLATKIYKTFKDYGVDTIVGNLANSSIPLIRQNLGRKQAALLALGQVGIEEAIYSTGGQVKLLDILKLERDNGNLTDESSLYKQILRTLGSKRSVDVPSSPTKDNVNDELLVKLLKDVSDKSIENKQILEKVNNNIINRGKLFRIDGNEYTFDEVMSGFLDDSKSPKLEQAFPTDPNKAPIFSNSSIPQDIKTLINDPDFGKDVLNELRAFVSSSSTDLNNPGLKGFNWEALRMRFVEQARALYNKIQVDKSVSKVTTFPKVTAQNRDDSKKLRILVAKISLLDKAQSVRHIAMGASSSNGVEVLNQADTELQGQYRNVTSILDEINNADKDLADGVQKQLSDDDKKQLNLAFGKIYGNLGTPVDPLLALYKLPLLKTTDFIVGSTLSNIVTEQTTLHSNGSNKANQEVLSSATIYTQVRAGIDPIIKSASEGLNKQVETGQGILTQANNNLGKAGQGFTGSSQAA